MIPQSTGPTLRRIAILGIIALAAPAGTGVAAQPDSSSRAISPHLRWQRESVLLGSGLALIVAGRQLGVTMRPVPPEGLDPAEIHWSLDRDQIGRIHPSALDASDIASAAS